MNSLKYAKAKIKKKESEVMTVKIKGELKKVMPIPLHVKFNLNENSYIDFWIDCHEHWDKVITNYKQLLWLKIPIKERKLLFYNFSITTIMNEVENTHIYGKDDLEQYKEKVMIIKNVTNLFYDIDKKEWHLKLCINEDNKYYPKVIKVYEKLIETITEFYNE